MPILSDKGKQLRQQGTNWLTELLLAPQLNLGGPNPEQEKVNSLAGMLAENIFPSGPEGDIGPQALGTITPKALRAVGNPSLAEALWEVEKKIPKSIRRDPQLVAKFPTQAESYARSLRDFPNEVPDYYGQYMPSESRGNPYTVTLPSGNKIKSNALEIPRDQSPEQILHTYGHEWWHNLQKKSAQKEGIYYPTMKNKPWDEAKKILYPETVPEYMPQAALGTPNQPGGALREHFKEVLEKDYHKIANRSDEELGQIYADTQKRKAELSSADIATHNRIRNMWIEGRKWDVTAAEATQAKWNTRKAQREMVEAQTRIDLAKRAKDTAAAEQAYKSHQAAFENYQTLQQEQGLAAPTNPLGKKVYSSGGK